jgi:hypothetical protein
MPEDFQGDGGIAVVPAANDPQLAESCAKSSHCQRGNDGNQFSAPPEASTPNEKSVCCMMSLEGKVTVPPDFDAPLPDGILEAFEERG